MKALAIEAIASAEDRSERPRIESTHSSDIDREFGAFVGQYQDLVVNTCYHFLRDADEAHDVAQGVFLAALQHLSRITDHAAWRAWLYRTASHRSLNALRARKRRSWLRRFESLRDEGIEPHDVAIAESKRPDREAETAELRRALDDAIAKLPARQRMAFVLHRYEGLSNNEIAVIMLIRANAVDALLHRARTYLRKQLLQQYQEFMEP